jgi:penicillin-binding protein 1A
MKKFFKYTFFLFLLISIVTAGGLFAYLYKLNSELPSIDELKDFKYKQPTIVYDSQNRIIAELGSERRYIVPMDKIPKYLQEAVVSVEDSRFYQHGGVDFIGILRAFITNIKAGRVVEGGSTLTQQLVKVIYLNPERKLKRKVKEAILAYKLDKNMTKDEILHLYLNQVYFGRGSYGVEAAALNYFGKHVWELNLSECAMIAGLPKAPGSYAPHRHYDRAVKRMGHVLYRMWEEGYITEEQYKEAKDQKVQIVEKVKSKLQHAGYFVDFIIKSLADKYDEKELRTSGYRIYTTLDLDFQDIAENAVRKNLINVSKRQGYFGVVADKEETYENLAKQYQYLTKIGFEIAQVEKVKRLTADILIGEEQKKFRLTIKRNRWARPYKSHLGRLDDFRKILKDGDFIFVEKRSEKDYRLTQEPKVEGALLSIKKDGAIVAMVGGFDFNKSMFNRATQAKRQVGSLFKPIVYSTAFENGYSVVSTVYDAPIIMQTGEEGNYWKPENFEKSFYGFTTLKKALTKSRNVVTIKLAQKVGVSRIIKQARKFGITSDLAKDLSISIGSGAISLKEMVRAYSAFVNLGEYQPLYGISKIENSKGEVVYEYEPPEKQRAISDATADIMSNVLINVVENGTGRRAKKIKRIIGGKTGTTNDYRDAWFMGIMPNLITGTWVGFDDFSSLGRLETGARAALPAWLDYTSKIVKKLPFEEFPVSPNVTYYKVDTETNQISDTYSDTFTFEPFADKVDTQEIKSIN